MAESNSRRERDLVLDPISYVYVQDLTKGRVDVHVGPHKTSLSNTDQPVIFDSRRKSFVEANLDEAIQKCIIAPEGWYIVLKNPSSDEKLPHPIGGNTSPPDLAIGNKVNIPGPVSFPLWPGQMTRTVQGHHLRSNQYLLVRVYNEKSAQDNWDQAVIKPAADSQPVPVTPITAAVDALKDDASEDVRKKAEAKDLKATETVQKKADTKKATETSSGDSPSLRVMGDVKPEDLGVGNLFIIEGTGVSFYIPPTGIEVVPDDDGSMVRQAVTLESLEYCILLDEDGEKRYERGPSVVFPKPTEKFMANTGGNEKFRAIELNEVSGVYLKVIKPYKEGNKQYKEGDELFITGNEQMIYFPRPEHAIIKYGEEKIHFAVAIPEGEARYIMSRLHGDIKLKKGPCMYLGDPRKEVIIKRILKPSQVDLWFPGNDEAKQHNEVLNEVLLSNKGNYLSDKDYETTVSASIGAEKLGTRAMYAGRKGLTADTFMGDEVNRRKKFTQPRSITLDTKYDGAVMIDVWTGYAIKIVSKSGDRRVVVGPKTVLLQYDESLEAFELSTGKPKNTDTVMSDVYLRVQNNKISDIISAETKDPCEISIKVSYRVNFEGKPEKWFDVDNYVKFLCDHVRSIVKNTIRKMSIQEFNADPYDIVRDAIIGKPVLVEEAVYDRPETAEGEEQAAQELVTPAVYGPRPGRPFEENGMRIYEVEVLTIRIQDRDIQKMIDEGQKNAVRQAIEVTSAEENLKAESQKEDIKVELATKRDGANEVLNKLDKKDIERDRSRILELEKTEDAIESSRQDRETAATAHETKLVELKREAKRLDLELADSFEGKKLARVIQELQERANSAVKRGQVVQPELVAALQALAQTGALESMAEHLAPLSLVKGQSLAGVLSSLLEGSPLEGFLGRLDNMKLGRPPLEDLDDYEANSQ